MLLQKKTAIALTQLLLEDVHIYVCVQLRENRKKVVMRHESLLILVCTQSK